MRQEPSSDGYGGGRRRPSQYEEAAPPIPNVAYDPERAAERFSSQSMAVGLRHMQLLGPLLTFLAKVCVDVRSGAEQRRRRQRAAELTSLISSLGPAIIKAGQALSSRSDLLPVEYLEELQQLQDRVPPIGNDEGASRHGHMLHGPMAACVARALPFASAAAPGRDGLPRPLIATAFSILEAELDRPLADVYSQIGSEPVAAASLGQVYRGVLACDGTTAVAVKVQRPGVEARVALDLLILRSYARALTALTAFFGRDIDLVAVIDDFGVRQARRLNCRILGSAPPPPCTRLLGSCAASPCFLPREAPDWIASSACAGLDLCGDGLRG